MFLEKSLSCRAKSCPEKLDSQGALSQMKLTKRFLNAGDLLGKHCLNVTKLLAVRKTVQVFGVMGS